MKSLSRLKRLTSLAIIIALTVALAFHSSSTKALQTETDDAPSVSTLTPEGRLIVFDDVWETIEQRYYDPSFHGIDWQASRTTFRPAAAQANSSREFYEVIRKMIGPLRDAHTRVYAPEEKFDWWNPRFITLGFTIREVEGAPTVIQVERSS